MKKVFYLLVVSTILFNCGTEDSDSIDPIIGEWQFYSDIENGVETITDCTKNTTFNFSEDGTLTVNLVFDVPNSGCMSGLETLKWVNIGASIYGLDDGNGDLKESKFTFSNNNTVFTSTETYGNDVYISKYKKI